MISLFADAGIPMIFLTFPAAIMLLVPVVIVEAFFYRRWLKLTMWEATKSSAVSNAASAVIGIPLAWGMMFIFEIATFGALVAVDGKLFETNHSPILMAVFYLMSAPWLGPITKPTWQIPAATLTLLAPFFGISYFIEYYLMKTMLRSPNIGLITDSPNRLRLAVRNANLVTYGIVFVGTAIWLAMTLKFPIFTPSTIVDFHPSYLQAKADSDFFYSIGDDLKYSNELSSQTPTLMHGQITQFLVSPDNSMIAVVVNGSLMVAGPNEPAVRKVTAVDSIYRDLINKKGIPKGKQFFRDNDFQWSRDSECLYLIKDEFYDSNGSQLFSSKGELWRYTLKDGTLRLVLKPFPAFNYFFGVFGIYFSVPTDHGDLQLKYFDGHSTEDIGQPNAQIPVTALSSQFAESPFFSFSNADYDKALKLMGEGVDLTIDKATGLQELKIGTRPFLSFTQGKGFAGQSYCSSTPNNAFLPGDRYFLFNVSCQSYEGQLLIDTQTGMYDRLPKDSRVYPRFNTDTVGHYRISGAGISP